MAAEAQPPRDDAPIAWVLNLDADLELAVPPGRAYAPTARVRAAIERMTPALAASLLRPCDVLVGEPLAPPSATGLAGRAFCPTPRALARLSAAGAIPEPHPPVDVLRRVNSRAFAAALGPTLPDGGFVRELDVARERLDRSPSVGEAWRVKRAFGMTGRGQRVIAPRAATAADLAFLRAAVSEGGVQIEPNVIIEREYAIHAMLDAALPAAVHAGAAPAVEIGALVLQRCDARGAWLATERLEAPTAGERDIERRLVEEAIRVAAALRGEGYFGPFGIDAFTYRAGEGPPVLQPRSEINARYGMGFAVGFGDREAARARRGGAP
jgi:hypothetical protein